MNLRNKILSGFIILALMLTIAGAWSIYHFQFIGNRVNRIMNREYKSINNSISMLHALEREDSAILLSLLGNLYESSLILQKADSSFLDGLKQAQSSIKENNHADLVSEIEENYKLYKDEWQDLHNLEPPKDLIKWYFANTHTQFLNVKISVENLLLASENELYATASNLKDLANRATMPGIIAIIAALAFTIMFSYFVHMYFISPIIKIVAAVKQNKKSGTPINIKVHSKDEMAELADSVNYLSLQIKNKNKK